MGNLNWKYVSISYMYYFFQAVIFHVCSDKNEKLKQEKRAKKVISSDVH